MVVPEDESIENSKPVLLLIARDTLLSSFTVNDTSTYQSSAELFLPHDPSAAAALAVSIAARVRDKNFFIVSSRQPFNEPT